MTFMSIYVEVFSLIRILYMVASGNPGVSQPYTFNPKQILKIKPKVTWNSLSDWAKRIKTQFSSAS